MLVANNVESLMAERTDRIMGLGTRNNSNAENMFDMLHDANMIGLDVQKRPLINSEGHEHSNLFELTHVDPKTGERVVYDSETAQSKFVPINFEEGFLEQGNALIGSGAKPLMAGTYNENKLGFCIYEIPVGFSIAGVDDPHNVQLLMQMGMVGQKTLQIEPRIIRLFCTNQIPALLRNPLGFGKRVSTVVKIRHTKNYKYYMGLAKETLQITETWVEEIEAIANKLVNVNLTTGQFAEIATEVFTPAKVLSGQTELDKRAESRRENMVGKVEEIFNGNSDTPDTLANVRGTAWAGYNALTEYLDWHRDGENSKNAVRRTAQAVGLERSPVTNQKQSILDVFERYIEKLPVQL